MRCEHATALVKGEEVRAVIGDFVEVTVPEGHDKGIIESILPRTRAFVRKDPTERALPQVLAANFDRVFVAQPLSDVNVRRLERELVLAYETGAAVTVVLTKADLAESDAEVAAGAIACARWPAPTCRPSSCRPTILPAWKRYARLCRRTPRPCSSAKAAWGSRA